MSIRILIYCGSITYKTHAESPRAFCPILGGTIFTPHCQIAYCCFSRDVSYRVQIAHENDLLPPRPVLFHAPIGDCRRLSLGTIGQDGLQHSSLWREGRRQNAGS
jgi:hypothetical protein